MPHQSILRRIVVALTTILAVAFGAPAFAQDEPADDAGVDALASQLQGKTGAGLSSVQLSGFLDVSYAKYMFTKESGMRSGFGDKGSFFLGNLNLYLDAALGQRVRTLVEVRFTYLPHGQTDRDATTYEATRRVYAADDYADLGRKVNLGSVIIQRAWGEYRLDDKLTLRAGQFLTPYGIWNVDHGSPAIISVLRPFIIGQQLIPEAQVGLEGYGTLHVGDSTLVGYHLTLSNGRIGNNPQYLSVSGRPGLGGRVFVESNAFGDLRVGLSGYTGTYEEASWALDPTTFIFQKQSTSKIEEWSVGTDAHWAWRGLVVNAEYLSNSMQFKVGKPTHYDGITPLDSDRRWGTYVLAGYSLPFHPQLMPFVMHEFMRSSDKMHHEPSSVSVLGHYPAGLADLYKWTVGLNYHVQPNMVVKAQYGAVQHRGPNANHFVDDSSEVFVQSAWAF